MAWPNVPGSYAERVVADPAKLVPIPDGVSTETAAAAMLQGMTAHYLASDSYPIEEGDWVLVHAASGGVGLLLTQIAKLRGGRVIGTTSSDEKAALARQAGANEVIGYDGFAERVKEITDGEGVAAVYDGVGKTTFLDGFKALRPTGRMILYGAASGQPDPLDTASLAAAGSLYVQRPTLNTYTRTPELLRDRARQLFELVETESSTSGSGAATRSTRRAGHTRTSKRGGRAESCCSSRTERTLHRGDAHLRHLRPHRGHSGHADAPAVPGSARSDQARRRGRVRGIPPRRAPRLRPVHGAQPGGVHRGRLARSRRRSGSARW